MGFYYHCVELVPRFISRKGCGSFAYLRIDMGRIPFYFLSRYLQAALTMIEKPKRKNAPAIISMDSTNEQSLLKSDSIPPIRHIAPIMLMALGTISLKLRSFSFWSNSLYRSYPDFGFSSIINKVLHEVTNSCGVMQLYA